MAADRELSQFLYHLTQEIVASKDYSDCNINQICGKYYENSTYPDRDRLRRLVSELKHKLKILQQDGSREVVCPASIEPVASQQSCCPASQSTDVPKYHRCGCPRSRDHLDDYCPYPTKSSTTVKKTTSDKCVDTTTSVEVFSPTKILISDSTQYSAPRSYHSYSTGTACGNSTCSNCGNFLNEQKSELVERSGYSPRSSEDSNTLVEQLLLKHSTAQQAAASSEILMRLAAGDRVLCESCHGKCPLHRCGHIRGRYEPPPVCPGKCDCGPSCRSTRIPAGKKPNCNCPLKNCKHMENDGMDGAGGSGGSGGLGRQGAILRQEASLTPPITCCGARRKKNQSAPQGTSCRRKSSKRNG
nr:uncharacterized protein LOC115262646 [Aedes albopictus]